MPTHRTIMPHTSPKSFAIRIYFTVWQNVWTSCLFNSARLSGSSGLSGLWEFSGLSGLSRLSGLSSLPYIRNKSCYRRCLYCLRCYHINEVIILLWNKRTTSMAVSRLLSRPKLLWLYLKTLAVTTIMWGFNSNRMALHPIWTWTCSCLKVCITLFVRVAMRFMGRGFVWHGIRYKDGIQYSLETLLVHIRGPFKDLFGRQKRATLHVCIC